MKKYLILTIAAAVSFYAFSAHAAYQFAVDTGGTLTTSLVSYFTMEGNSNDVWGSDNGTDSSVSYGSSYGKVDEGANLSSGYIANLTATDWPTSNAARSISFWIKTSSGSSQRAAVYYGTGAVGQAFYIAVASDNTLDVFSYGAGNEVKSSTVIADGTWHYVVVSTSGSNIYEYVDNSLAASGSFSSLATLGSHFGIGARSDGGEALGGDMDEVGVWSKQLSSQEMTDLYNSGSGDRFSNVVTHNIVSTNQTGNGTLSPTGTISVVDGANQTFNFTPNTGYTAYKSIDSGSTSTAGSSYTFSNVTAGHTIDGYFYPTIYSITESNSAHGTVTPTGTVSVAYGNDQTFSISPNTGYTAYKSVDSGATSTVGSTYTFSNVTANHTFDIYFYPTVYTITESNTSHGTVTPTGTVSVAYGGNQTFTITPSGGYTAYKSIDSGSTSTVGSSYTFSNVTANHTIDVYFYVSGGGGGGGGGFTSSSVAVVSAAAASIGSGFSTIWLPIWRVMIVLAILVVAVGIILAIVKRRRVSPLQK